MSNELRHIIEKLKYAKSLETLYILLTGLLSAGTVAVLAILFVSLIEIIARGDSSLRTVLFAFTCFLAIGALIFFLKPFFQRRFSKRHNPDLNSIAKRVGFQYPEINDSLSNTVQLLTINNNNKATSAELAESAFGIVYVQSKDKDFTRIIDKKKTRKTFYLFLASFGLVLLLFISFSSSLTSALTRIINFDKEYIPPAPFSLDINPKSMTISRGSQVQIVVSSKGKTPDFVELHVREFQQKNYEVLNLKPDSSGKFVYYISSARNSLEYFAQSPWVNTFVKTQTCSLVVTAQPVIKSLSGRIIYPSYTNLSPSEFDEQSADITALKGSSVDFTILANKDLNSANLVFIGSAGVSDTLVKSSDTSRTAMNISGNKAMTRFVIRKSGNYYFEIKDKSNQSNVEPVVYSLAMLTDEYPSIELEEPRTNVIVDENALVPIKVSITDDYGFSHLKLFYKLVESRYTEPDKNYTSINIPLLSNELSISVPYLWDLNKVNMSPEDKYEFYLEVSDNDIVSGPKTSRTNTLTVRLPSLDEVLETADDMQKKIAEDAKKLLKETEELKKDMDQFGNDLMQKPKGSQMDWKEKKKAEEITKKQESLQQKIDELQKNLEKMTNNLEQNNALSPETLQKYLELQKLLKEVNSPELQKLQEQMQRALQNMSKEQLEQAMKNAKFDEEQFRKSIERTTKILKRLQAEQKTDALQKRAEELEKKQDELNKKTENSNLGDKETKDKLSKEQNNLQKDLKELEKEAKELEKLMKEIGGDMPLPDMQKAMEELNSDETAGEMEKAQEQIQQGEQSNAGKSQKKAKSNIGKFSESMKQMKQKMQNNVSKEAMRKMQKAISDLLELSQEQEKLNQETSNLDYHSSQIPQLTDQQMQIQQSLKNVASSMMELSEKSFAFTPQMAQELGNAMQQMQSSMQQLSDRSMSGSQQSQTRSMSSLNKAAAQMQAMLNSMQNKSGQCDNPGGQGQGQGSGMTFSQRMQQLSQQQQGINSGMQQAMGQQSKDGQLTPQQQAELGRIAKEQGNAKKALEDLAKEQKQMGGERQSLGDLNQIAKEMSEVISDMHNGNVTPETLRKQERILSRLLDANLSMNERDYEKERESKTGQQFNRKGPDQLKINDSQQKQTMEQMLRSLQLGYTKDYENLIRKYFEALQNGNGKNK